MHLIKDNASQQQGMYSKSLRIKSAIIALLLAPILAISLYKLTFASKLEQLPMGPLSVASYQPSLKLGGTSTEGGTFQTLQGDLDPLYGTFSMNPLSDLQPFNGPSVLFALGLITFFSFCLVF